MKKKISKKRLTYYILAVVILIVFLFFLIYKKNNLIDDNYLIKVSLGDCYFNLEPVSSPSGWYKGLSDREVMEKHQGMLFIFPNYKKRNFVMRGMKFPLDIIYLKDNRVVNIEQGKVLTSQLNTLTEYKSYGEVNMVVEIRQGVADECKVTEESELIIIN